MSRRTVRHILLMLRLGTLTVDQAEQELSIRTTSLNRDILLFCIGVALGSWVGALICWSGHH